MSRVLGIVGLAVAALVIVGASVVYYASASTAPCRSRVVRVPAASVAYVAADGAVRRAAAPGGGSGVVWGCRP